MNLVLRGAAAIIDLLQFLFFILFLGLAAITPVGGGLVGAATGAAICYNASGNIVSGAVNAVYCAVAGAGIGALAAPIGIIIDTALSCTFGILLILLLWVSGRFSFMAIAMGFGAEMLPGLNAFVPGWSLLVHRSIQQYNSTKKEGAATSRTSFGILTTAAKLVPVLAGGTAAALMRRVPAAAPASAGPEPRQTSGRVPLQTKNFDGIRPANDNRPQSYAQAA